MIVYLAGDIPTFVMYCVYGESGSSLLIESTDSMIHIYCIYTLESHLSEHIGTKAVEIVKCSYNLSNKYQPKLHTKNVIILQ